MVPGGVAPLQGQINWLDSSSNFWSGHDYTTQKAKYFYPRVSQCQPVKSKFECITMGRRKINFQIPFFQFLNDVTIEICISNTAQFAIAELLTTANEAWRKSLLRFYFETYSKAPSFNHQIKQYFRFLSKTMIAWSKFKFEHPLLEILLLKSDQMLF